MKPTLEEMKELQAAATQDLEAGLAANDVVMKIVSSGVDYEIAVELVRHAQFLVSRERAPLVAEQEESQAWRGLLWGPLLFVLGMGTVFIASHHQNGYTIIFPSLIVLGIVMSIGCFFLVMKQLLRKGLRTISGWFKKPEG
jgi:hypothetical protein